VYWASYGLGYLVSVVFSLHMAQLAAVVTVVIMFSQNGVTPKLPDFQKMAKPLCYLPYASYLFYSQQVSYLIELKEYSSIYNIQKSLNIFGYKQEKMNLWICLILVYGIAFRFLALIVLYCTAPNSLWYRMLAFVNGTWIRIRRKIIHIMSRKDKEAYA
jgi:hypothetical protein